MFYVCSISRVGPRFREWTRRLVLLEETEVGGLETSAAMHAHPLAGDQPHPPACTQSAPQYIKGM
jgi:hypothetical protein